MKTRKGGVEMKRIKMKAAAIWAVLMTLFMSMTVLASDPVADMDLAGAIGDGVSGMVSEILGILVVVLPIALGLIGMVIAIRKGIKLVRSLVGG